ncbi:hypothetical protein EMCRGX_G021014 [Ephydatia muelleri]|eukprot:Em0016g929a
MEPAPNLYEDSSQMLKILLVGDAVSKKRTLLKKYLGDENINDVTTLGLDYKLKDIVYKGRKYKLQIWDTAGQERFRSVTSSYYRGSHGGLVVCSVVESTSFLNLQYWLDEIKNYAPSHFHIILVAICATEDSEEVQAITLETVRRFAEDKRLQLVECNLEQPDDVTRVFMTLLESIVSAGSSPKVTDESVALEQPTQSNSCPC